MSDFRKEYTNGEITIVWQPRMCMHSGICAKGLPEVFKPKDKPWITITAASTEQLKAQVSKCPSGALSFLINDAPTDAALDTNSVQLTVVPNGPLLVSGKMTITHADGRVEEKESNTALCRCGASANKPFCDGTHRKIDFKG